MNPENQKAYVLHTRNYRESSQIVDLFSRDFGRLRAVAKGNRGKRKSGGQQLQAFVPFSLSWRGKGDLKNLTTVEALGNRAVLHGEMLYIGLYLNELLVRLLPEYMPHGTLFEYYGELILKLGISHDPEPLLRRFELLLLEEMGYGFDLTHEIIENRPIAPAEYYHFSPDQGFIRIDSIAKSSEENGYRGEYLLAIAEDNYQLVEVRKCAKRLLRTALRAQLGDRPLLSRQLFSQVSSQTR